MKSGDLLAKNKDKNRLSEEEKLELLEFIHRWEVIAFIILSVVSSPILAQFIELRFDRIAPTKPEHSVLIAIIFLSLMAILAIVSLIITGIEKIISKHK